MKKSQEQSNWWDWPCVALAFALLHVVASRLVTTDWTDYLPFTQTLTSMGFVIGAALGYSRFKARTARRLSFWYMVVILPLIWIRVIDKEVEPYERFISVGGRLWYSFMDFFANRPVEDPLFFVSIVCAAFWVLSASAGFNLIRRQNFLWTVIPSAIGLIVIQQFDNLLPGRLWFLAVLIFLALCLLGRLNFLQNRRAWSERRIFLSPENSIDLTSSMTIIAIIVTATAMLVPLSISRVDALRDAWKRVTKPWTEFTESMENAVSALESPVGGTPTEFYGTELELGRGFPLSDTVMFRVDIPDLLPDQKPPRYYWRGRTYDYFSNGQWYITGSTRADYAPAAPTILIADTADRITARFIFTLGSSRSALLYAPSEPIWVSRPGSYLAAQAEGGKNIISWNATPALQPGETYQVDAALIDPNVQQLREAGAEYPQWVTQAYLQTPDNFSPRIRELAQEIAAEAETPYDKALAITSYLRANIEYEAALPEPPSIAKALEWVLFDYKKGYCVYYATAEVLMLRSVGIPARLAVGFAQGSGSVEEAPGGRVEDFTITSYTVRKKNAHAWPEAYFPGIGWVEFEPTGNQAPLERPLTPGDALDLAGNPIRNLPQEDNVELPANDPLNEPVDPNAGSGNRLAPTFYLILLLSTLAALTVFLNRRYNLPARVPIFVRATLERTGVEVPRWVIRWERWSALSSIERSFESVNFALRRIKHPAPPHATPIERANSLADSLPGLEPVIKVLLDEHQTSLYTSRVADENNARRAARQIRLQILISLWRHFLTGHYEAQVSEPRT